MERDYRLVAGAKTVRRLRGATRSGATALLLAILLAAAGAVSSSDGEEEAGLATTPDSDELPIIVHLLASEETGSENGIAAVTARTDPHRECPRI